MAVALHAPARRRQRTSAEQPRAVRAGAWTALCLLAVLLPVAGLALAAVTGSEAWLVPAAVVAGLVVVALTVWT